MVIGHDIVKVLSPDTKKLSAIRFWGDKVKIKSEDNNFYKIEFFDKKMDKNVSGLISKKTNLIDPDQNKILSVSFIDVQQGDAMVVESPKGKKILIDGGDNQLFARYLASRFPNSSKEDPIIIDAIVVTHGDADHFTGLTEIYKSEKNENIAKRLFIFPKRIFHNGIVKGPSKVDGKSVSVQEIFGKTFVQENKTYLIDLVNDLIKIRDERLNGPFKRWINAIKGWKTHEKTNETMTIKRLQYGDDTEFSFLSDEKIAIKVLGPNTEIINNKTALSLLHEPSDRINMILTDELELQHSKTYSASHTINGHSIVLQIKYGNVKFFLAGDLNHEAEKKLVELTVKNEINISSEILKVPHHGSSDFDSKFLKNVKPIISIISSGDESVKKEYIHPRASLVGALGKYARTGSPVIFVTELAAFFEKVGYTKLADEKIGKESTKKDKGDATSSFFAFKRTQYGIVHIRTDGNRVLAFTHSGRQDLKEAYAFRIDENEKISPEKINKI